MRWKRRDAAEGKIHKTIDGQKRIKPESFRHPLTISYRTRGCPRIYSSVSAVESPHALAHAMQKLWRAQRKRCERSGGSVAKSKAKRLGAERCRAFIHLTALPDQMLLAPQPTLTREEKDGKGRTQLPTNSPKTRPPMIVRKVSVYAGFPYFPLSAPVQDYRVSMY